MATKKDDHIVDTSNYLIYHVLGAKLIWQGHDMTNGGFRESIHKDIAERKAIVNKACIAYRDSSLRAFAYAQLGVNIDVPNKSKAKSLNILEEKIPEKNYKSLSKAFINYLDSIEKGQLAIIKEIEKIIPEGAELTPIQIEKVVPPYVDVKIPVPEPRIPLDPKIPIPYPKTPLDPKIPIPRPEIKIHGPYAIKDLEIKLAEVERIRKSLPKNATKAEKKAAANAEQQIKNLLKAAKRAEPKATKKAVVKKATVKKAAKKKK